MFILRLELMLGHPPPVYLEYISVHCLDDTNATCKKCCVGTGLMGNGDVQASRAHEGKLMSLRTDLHKFGGSPYKHNTQIT